MEFTEKYNHQKVLHTVRPIFDFFLQATLLNIKIYPLSGNKSRKIVSLQTYIYIFS